MTDPKLSSNDKARIRRAYEKGQLTTRELAVMFQVSQTLIQRIVAPKPAPPPPDVVEDL